MSSHEHRRSPSLRATLNSSPGRADECWLRRLIPCLNEAETSSAACPGVTTLAEHGIAGEVVSPTTLRDGRSAPSWSRRGRARGHRAPPRLGTPTWRASPRRGRHIVMAIADLTSTSGTSALPGRAGEAARPRDGGPHGRHPARAMPWLHRYIGNRPQRHAQRVLPHGRARCPLRHARLPPRRLIARPDAPPAWSSPTRW